MSPSSPKSELESLDTLAKRRGIETAYLDVTGSWQQASPEAICALLSTLGERLESPAGAPAMLAAELGEDHSATKPVPESAVQWQGRSLRLPLMVSKRRRFFPVEIQLELGDMRGLKLEIHRDDRGAFVNLPKDLPPGRHQLHATGRGLAGVCQLLCAPTQAVAPGFEASGGMTSSEALPRQDLGLFMPLHALHSGTSYGIGDLGDLQRLGSWSAHHGVKLLGTLPLLDTFLDSPFEPSPYAPISRQFFGPHFIDLEALPELATSPRARALLGSPEAQALLEAQRRGAPVDYHAVGAFKFRVLKALAQSLAEGPSARAEDFEAYQSAHPALMDYARFRAHTAATGLPFRAWAPAARDGMLGPAEVDLSRLSTQLYAGWAIHTQLQDTCAHLDALGVSLYLDFPVGVHPDGYDLWRERSLFLQGASVGAPPDPLFSGGQNWGFPPLNPQASRAQGHAYLWRCLETHLQHAKVLRLDHVMGLARLFLIPAGFPATEGLYLRMPKEELFGLVTLASQRFGARIVGENLGTIPPAIEEAMPRHRVQGMSVAQFGLSEDARAALPPPPPGSLASLNTHDAPTFAGFAAGADLELSVELGLSAQDALAEAKEGRARVLRALERTLRARSTLRGEATPAAMAEGCYRILAESKAQTVLVNLEDLWGEPQPQNVPGTTSQERLNWRRRASKDLESIETDLALATALDHIDQARHPRPSLVLPTIDEDAQLTDTDCFLFAEGSHRRLYRKLGAHPLPGGGGTRFAVWAPEAKAVSLIGEFNHWEAGATPLSPHGGSGIWETVVLGVRPGALYKYHLVSRHNQEVLQKADPFAFATEEPPLTASKVWQPSYDWQDEDWLAERAGRSALDAPIAIYELHLGSFKRAQDGSFLGYRELAAPLIEHLQATGFTHVEFMPVMEHPFYGSWGYQVTSYFAPSARYGTPEDLMYLIDALHQAGIAVILDWVPAHFPMDAHGLARFDGSHLYEHADPRKGHHPDWDTAIFNYGRNEVRAFLLSSALFWLDLFHVDGLRVDAVASMLYLDYSRKEGEWIPNQHGGRENLEALSLLRQMNEVVYAEYPGVQTFAEESTAWPGVSRPTYVGGVGFGFKWDMGWMHDTLAYLADDPIHRRWQHHRLTFRGLYAFSENFCLPLSHDEVVHGKGSLMGKMPGDAWQQRANLRLLLAAQWGQPGKKLLFMGCEFGQVREWNHDSELQWELLEQEEHRGLMKLVSDLNQLYREEPALHVFDCDARGLQWVEANDADNGVFAWLRNGPGLDDEMLVVLNATPIVRHAYRLGVPRAGTWEERLNTDARCYGGSDVGNLGAVAAHAPEHHDWPASLSLSLPPLGALFLSRKSLT